MTATIQERLAERKLVPREHLVDTSYVTSDHLVSSAKSEIDLVGPVLEDQSWQARAKEGFGAAQFVIDWEKQQAHCPQGKTSVTWRPTKDCTGQEVVSIRFSWQECRACPVHVQCVRSGRERALMLRTQEQYEALQTARRRQATDLFQEQYAARAGIEGTISQGTRISDLRRSRYIGEAKTRLLHLLIGAALNFVRVAAWLADVPRAQTRRSAFARLAPALT
jgi:transposase